MDVFEICVSILFLGIPAYPLDDETKIYWKYCNLLKEIATKRGIPFLDYSIVVDYDLRKNHIVKFIILKIMAAEFILMSWVMQY